jgi:Phage integrase family
VPSQLAVELERLRSERQPAPQEPVFCGLKGGRLGTNVLADIIRRSAKRAELSKHVTAHTLRHTAATWLRQATGDTRIVAEYLGHADLSTVSRYAHVANEEMHVAVQALADQAGLGSAGAIPEMLDARAKILDQEDQVQWMRWRAFKAELQVPLAGALVDRVNEQGTYPD